MEVNVGDYTPTDGCPFPFQTSNLPETFINRPRPPRPTRRSDRQTMLVPVYGRTDLPFRS